MVEATTYDQQQHMAIANTGVRQGVLLLDRAGYVTFANSAAQALLAGPSGALHGRRFTDFWDAIHWDAAHWINDDSHHFETVLRLANGRSLTATVSIVSFDDRERGSRLVSIITGADFSLVSAALSHTQKLAGIGMLAASVAHELNNPISIITSTCDNLKSGIDDNSLTREGLARYVEVIEQSAWRCARIVEALKTYSHRAQFQIIATDLNQIIRDALMLVSEQFQSQYNVMIKTTLAPLLPPVVADPNQITQVLINLLTNARDALQPEGGAIAVTTSVVEGGERVAFAVADTGPGIQPTLMGRVFEPFFTTKPIGEGTGLGLSIAAEIVERHHGRIMVANRSEGGAIFTVLLPAVSA